MSLSVHHNMPIINITRGLSAVGREKAKTAEKISSGYRINTAADGPADLAMSEKLRAQIEGLEKAIQNVTTAQDVMSIAEGGLGQVQSIISTMRQYAVHALNSGVISPEEIAADQAQVDTAMQSVERILATTAYAGRKLLDHITTGSIHSYAENVDSPDQDGAMDAATPATSWLRMETPPAAGNPDEGRTALTLESVAGAPPKDGAVVLSGEAPILPKTLDGSGLSGRDRKILETSQLLTNLSSGALGAVVMKDAATGQMRAYHLADIMSGGGASLSANPEAALKVLEQGGRDVAMHRAALGAAQNKLDSLGENIRTQHEKLTQTESFIRDVDYSQEIVKNARLQIQEQVGMRLLESAMQNGKAILDLMA